MVRAIQHLLEIADLDRFGIDVRLDQREASGLATGQPASVKFRPLQGRHLASVRLQP